MLQVDHPTRRAKYAIHTSCKGRSTTGRETGHAFFLPSLLWKKKKLQISSGCCKFSEPYSKHNFHTHTHTPDQAQPNTILCHSLRLASCSAILRKVFVPVDKRKQAECFSWQIPVCFQSVHELQPTSLSPTSKHKPTPCPR